jgi:hypothetical protein
MKKDPIKFEFIDDDEIVEVRKPKVEIDYINKCFVTCEMFEFVEESKECICNFDKIPVSIWVHFNNNVCPDRRWFKTVDGKRPKNAPTGRLDENLLVRHGNDRPNSGQKCDDPTRGDN